MMMMMMHQESFSRIQAPRSSRGVLAAMPADCCWLVLSYPFIMLVVFSKRGDRQLLLTIYFVGRAAHFQMRQCRNSSDRLYIRLWYRRHVPIETRAGTIAY